MRIVLQKVKKAAVYVDNIIVGQIEHCVLLFLGIHKDDQKQDSEILIKKILEGRIFPDASEGKYFDRSLQETRSDILVVSQFTLYANMKKGRRPSFDDAASPEAAKELYEDFLKKLKNTYSGHVASGIFQADMEVSLTNDGPVTLIYNSTDL